MAPPPLYEDELWYSVIARLLRDWAYVNRGEELHRIFGAYAPKICIPVPQRPKQLAAAFAQTSPLAAYDFVMQHTLLPYFLAFAGPKQRAAVALRLAGDTFVTGLHLGAAVRRHAPAHLRFCESCIEQDRADVSEPYWRRSHQCPFVSRCPRHRTPLHQSSVPYRPQVLEYWTAHRSRCQPGPATRVQPPAGRLLARAIEIMSWLSLALGGIRQLWISRSRYVTLLALGGFGASRGRVAATKVEASFADFLRCRGCDATTFGAPRWWLPVFTDVRGVVAPVQHVVFREFLRVRLRERGVLKPQCGVREGQLALVG